MCMPFSFCVIPIVTLNSVLDSSQQLKLYSLNVLKACNLPLSIMHTLYTSLLLIFFLFHLYLSRHYNNWRVTRKLSGYFNLEIPIDFFFYLFFLYNNTRAKFSRVNKAIINK